MKLNMQITLLPKINGKSDLSSIIFMKTTCYSMKFSSKTCWAVDKLFSNKFFPPYILYRVFPNTNVVILRRCSFSLFAIENSLRRSDGQKYTIQSLSALGRYFLVVINKLLSIISFCVRHHHLVAVFWKKQCLRAFFLEFEMCDNQWGNGLWSGL